VPLLSFRQGQRVGQLVLALRPDPPRGLGSEADIVTDHVHNYWLYFVTDDGLVWDDPFYPKPLHHGFGYACWCGEQGFPKSALAAQGTIPPDGRAEDRTPL
jgi:hypothetical protein